MTLTASRDAVTRARMSAYGHVLIVVECRGGAWSAVEQGLRLAHEHGARATLALALPHLSSVMVEMAGMPVTASDPLALELARRGAGQLARAQQKARSLDVAVHSVTLQGLDLPAVIVDRAMRLAADVIVVACEPANAVRRLLGGSLVPGLISASSVPLIVCPDELPG